MQTWKYQGLPPYSASDIHQDTRVDHVVFKPDPTYFPVCIITLDHDIRGLLRETSALP